MISDAELLKLVMDRYPEQPTNFLLEQFTQLKAGIIQANNKLANLEELPVIPEPLSEMEEPSKEEPAGEVAPKKKYTKRNLVVKPEEALTDDSVQCCICGKAFQNLTAKHILSHDLSVEDYKKLCGYSPDQKLISINLLNKLQANVQKAQASREAQRTGSHLK